MSWSARITQADFARLHAHLFPGDADEHAAFLLAGAMSVPGGHRLLVREVIEVPARDFGPSDRGGYRQVSGAAVARAALACERMGLRLLWAHSHPGAGDRVAFSAPDRRTHARAHPGLIALTGGRTVGALVFGEDAVAGELWTPGGAVQPLERLDVVGARMCTLRPAPAAGGRRAAERFARQVLIFGADGQRRLAEMTVVVVGAGGGGSLIVQGLAHLGVGRIVVVDFDRVQESNLSRIVGAQPRDARRRRRKVDVMRRLVRRIDPSVDLVAVAGNVASASIARLIAGADFVFSATDTMLARFAVNAVTHQYLVPAAQVGAKVVADPASGELRLAYSMYRPVDFSAGCLECCGAIDSEQLRCEQLGERERRDQAYVDGAAEPLPDPAVLALNSVATSLALLDFQLAATGVHRPGATLDHRVYHALDRELRERSEPPRPGCRWCDAAAGSSCLARGDDLPLPLAPGPPVRRRRRAWTLFRH